MELGFRSRPDCLGAADHTPRAPPYPREPDDRGWRELQGAVGVHGHADIGITLNRYRHLMPGAGDEAAELLDAYLATWRLETGGDPHSSSSLAPPSAPVTPSAEWRPAA
jgi:hypothetical protein